MDDRYGVFVNHATGSSFVPMGGKMLVWAIDGAGNRLHAFARSRSGRMVDAWFGIKDVENARVKTVTLGSPYFDMAIENQDWAQGILDRLNSCIPAASEP